MLIVQLWMCTTMQQGHGRRLSSAWRAVILRLHLSGTWLCSLGVKQTVRFCADREGVVWVDAFSCVFCVFMLAAVLLFCPATAFCLMRSTAGSSTIATDVYNGATGAWSTAQLSFARCYLAAASVGNAALFAGGGNTGGALLCTERGFRVVYCCMRVLCFVLDAVLRLCLPCDRFLSHARHCSWWCSF